MKRILVASDFSACSGNALAYALNLAKTLQFEVTVIHAISSTEGINNNTYDAIYIEDYYKRKREGLADWVKLYSSKDKFKTIPVSTLCEVGSLALVVKKYIEQNPVEFLVMGTMGSSGISGLFGTNTQMMVEKTKIPTLIIPLETRFSKKSIITLATDFTSKLSKKDLTGIKELISVMGSKKLNILNIVAGPDWKKNDLGETQWKKLLPKIKLDFKYLQETNTLGGIINFILSSHTDIICLVKHHHNIAYRLFNKSTVNQVLVSPIKAVLVLHE
jgi:nucleotide-binding universal stress UspA family protein